MPLPIIQRELSLASRKRTTIWLRIVAAALAVLIGGAGLLIQSVAGGTASVGRVVFSMLTWLSLAAIVGAGVFLTADSLSEEKRAGTLGLLFLTDLRGYDVVLGKLITTSLRGFEALLAVLPVLGITLIAGGVLPEQFFKTCLALVNVLFCSNAVGLFVSAFSRQQLRAVSRTIVFLLILFAGGPLIDAAIAANSGGIFAPRASLVSPIFVFLAANSFALVPFWQGLALSHLVGWLFIGSAAVFLPFWWQDRPLKQYRWAFRKLAPVPGFGSRARRWLDRNPVQWLAARERRQALGLWLLVIAMVALFVVATQLFGPEFWFGWSYIFSLIAPILYIWIAVRTCSFFAEARRSGFLELLMVTPVGPAQIVQGFWRCFLHAFGWPVLLLLLLQLTGAFMGRQIGRGAMQSALAGFEPWLMMIASSVSAIVITATNLAAIVWFGMWMGLTSRTTAAAALKTVAFVLVLPWLAGSFISMLAIPLLLVSSLVKGGGASASSWIIFALSGAGLSMVLFVAKNIFFIIWARKRLLNRFRAEVAGGNEVFRVTPPPLIQPPPVIAMPGGAA